MDNGVTSNGSTEKLDDTTPVTFFAAQPTSHGHSMIGLLKHAQPTRIDATFPTDSRKQTWQQKVSLTCVKVLWCRYAVMKLMGFMTEFTLNFLVLNHGLLGLLFKLITFKWRKYCSSKVPRLFRDVRVFFATLLCCEHRTHSYCDVQTAL